MHFQNLHGTMYSHSINFKLTHKCIEYLNISDGKSAHTVNSVPFFFWSRKDIDYAVSLAHSSLRLCPALAWLSLYHFLDCSSNCVWGDEFRHPADLLAPVKPDSNMRREK